MQSSNRAPRRNNRLWKLVPPIAYTALLLLVSSIPGSVGPEGPRVPTFFLWLPATVQNFLHVPQYAVLSWLWCRGLASGRDALHIGIWRATVLCGVYAIWEELYQRWIPGRYSSLTDLIMDAIGIAVGVVLFRGLHRKSERARLDQRPP